MGEMADALFHDDAEWECPTAKLITCNRCGEDDLHWEAFNDGTSCLYTEERARHVCKPDTEGFEAL